MFLSFSKVFMYFVDKTRIFVPKNVSFVKTGPAAGPDHSCSGPHCQDRAELETI